MRCPGGTSSFRSWTSTPSLSSSSSDHGDCFCLERAFDRRLDEKEEKSGAARDGVTVPLTMNRDGDGLISALDDTFVGV